MVEFDWDDANTEHVARHDVTPSEAEQVLKNDPADGGVQDHDGEERRVEVGMTDALRFLVVITTSRDDTIRVVTAYPASPAARQFYTLEKGIK
ncbi:BrnT family toxin [soil metagenome]